MSQQALDNLKIANLTENDDVFTWYETAQAYSLLNFRLGILREGLDLSAFVSNATRSHPLIGYNNVFYGNPLFEAAATRPLTAGITALYRF